MLWFMIVDHFIPHMKEDLLPKILPKNLTLIKKWWIKAKLRIPKVSFYYWYCIFFWRDFFDSDFFTHLENQCYEYPDESSEDQCLNNCLIQRFLKEFGCLHERLRPIDLKNETLQRMKPCILQDLEPKYEEMVKLENNEKSDSVFPDSETGARSECLLFVFKIDIC